MFTTEVDRADKRERRNTLKVKTNSETLGFTSERQKIFGNPDKKVDLGEFHKLTEFREETQA